MYIQMENKINNSPIKKVVYDKKYWNKSTYGYYGKK